MFKEFFLAVVYNPLYNWLVFLIDVVPLADVGIAVIILTLAVKFILFPLTRGAIRSQALMNAIKPDLDLIRDTHKDDRQEQARQTMALYKEKGIHPFSVIVPLFIQIPIIFGLYWVFLKGGLPNVNVDVLYSFIPVPTNVNMHFLGQIDMAGKSIILALLAGATQFLHARLSMPKLSAVSGERYFKDDLAKSFQFQMRYVFPVMVAIIAYTISAAVALYWLTSNVFSIGQEILVRRTLGEHKKLL